MLLTIYNLPVNIRYNDIKSLIHSKCALTDVILDNLMPEGTGKKVTVGVAEEEDAAVLVRNINGIYINGHQLYVEDSRRKKAAEKPARSATNLNQETIYSGYQNPEQPSTQNQGSVAPLPVPPPVQMQGYMNMAMQQMQGYMPLVQNDPYLGYGGQSQQTVNPMMPQFQQAAGQMDRPFGIEAELNTGNFHPWAPSTVVSNEQSTFQTANETVKAGPRSRSPEAGYNTYNRPSRDFAGRGHGRKNFGKNISPWRDQQPRSPPRGPDARRRDAPAPAPAPADRSQKRPYDDRSEGFSQNNNGRKSTSRFDGPRSSPPRFSGRNDRGSHGQGPSRGNDPRWEDTEAFQACARDERFPPSRFKWQRSDREPARDQPRDQPRDWRQRDPTAPPPKRMRHPNSDYEEPRTKKFAAPAPRPDDRKKPVQKNQQTNNKAKAQSANQAMSALKIQNRTITFRGQAAATLLKHMLSNEKLQIPPNLMTPVKHALRERIDAMMEGTSDVPCEDIVRLYRLSFPKRSDRPFLNKVIKTKNNEIAAKEGRSDPATNEGQAKNVEAVAGPSTSQPLFVPAGTVPNPVVGETQATVAKLPKYAEGCKKKHQQTKKMNKMEIQDPSVYSLDPVQDKILDEEIDIIVNMFLEEFANPVTDLDNRLKKRLSDHVVKELKWLFKLPTIKRILDVKTSLLIRIFGQPKPPKRAALEAFLIPYGAVSLKKSDRKPLYVTCCDSFENYDRLCRLGSAVIDGISCSFKPMHVAGIPNKGKGHNRFRFNDPQKSNSGASNAAQITPPVLTLKAEENIQMIKDEVKKEISEIEGTTVENNNAVNDPITNTDLIKIEMDALKADISSGITDIVPNDPSLSKDDNASREHVTDLKEENIKPDNKAIDAVEDTEKNVNTNDINKNEFTDSEGIDLNTEINDVIASLNNDNNDAQGNANFPAVDMNALIDVDVKDLKDDDLEDY